MSGAAFSGAFERAFSITVGHEGDALDLTYGDDGNWTGGAVGNGELKGSRFGISAAAHPNVDIAGLTRDGAEAIYRREYWPAIRGDELPPPLAVICFDGAVNNGPSHATRWLQASVGARVDGDLGAETMEAIDRAASGSGVALAVASFMALRTDFMANSPKWRRFGEGWSPRLARLPLQAFGLLGA
jgi:lysozyme family protein